MPFFEFAHILWDTTKPNNVRTDNKLVASFFRTKAVTPAPWSAFDYVLQVIFKIVHIARSVNTAADVLSGPELKDASLNPG